MLRLRGLVLFCILFLLSISLTSCTSTYWDIAPPPSRPVVGAIAGAAGGAVIGSVAAGGAGTAMGAAIGSIWGAGFGEIIAHHQTEIENLMYNGVQVLQVGDEIKLILPSDRFFHPNSPNLNPNYYRVLDDIAKFLRKFKKVNIQVAVYTDNLGSWRRNLALSRLQARNMMNYLWLCGVDARLMYAVGYGDAYPIASNSTPKGRYMNRRIEISLRKIEPSPLI